jgi:TonB family protein
LIEKVRDIVGLCLNPPAHAAVFCFDEKPQIETLDQIYLYGGTCDPSVQAPVPLREVRPSYTADDLRARTDGTVLLHGVVDEQGQVIDVRIVRSLSVGLDNESTKAFVQWRFQPALRLGTPVAVAITGEFQFHSGLEGERPGR